MRRILVLLLGSLVLASSALAAPTQGRPTPTPGQDEDHEEERDREEREEGRQDDVRGHRVPAPIGAFVLEETAHAVTGEHLSFSYSENGIDDFRAGDQTLFDIVVQPTDKIDEDEDEEGRDARVESTGAMFRVRTSNFTFIAHDNPGATGKLETDGRVLVTFGPNVQVTGKEERARFTSGNVSGFIRGDHLVIVGGNTVTASDGILVFLEEPRGSFDKHRSDIGQAIARGHVGAEATFNAIQNGADEVEHEVVSYGNVTMTTLKAERGNLTLLVEGHGFEGRVLVLNVDGRVVGADAAEKLHILLDNVTVAPASNLTDILDPDDDGFAPERYLVYDPAAEAFQLIVTVPHYSVHTLSVTLVELVQPSVVIGMLAGVALLVPAAMLLFRRK